MIALSSFNSSFLIVLEEFLNLKLNLSYTKCFLRKDALFTLDIQIDVVKEVAGMAGGEKLFWPSGYTSSVTDP